MMTMMTKIYHSREDRVGTIQESEAGRFNWDNIDEDIEKAEAALDAIYEFNSELNEAATNYVDMIAGMQDRNDEDTDRAVMLHHRQEMVYAWSMAQAALSKFAWVMRIDGNKAYESLIGAIETGNTADMSGL